ncbi:hypothetical protein GCM10010400_76300 [Streptomyces aculeolatus]|uniref:GIY-YIG nuclease family protein n=1 Tax=Streptomyces aculeolatus TaxID=270689 RepID=UPI001CEDE5F1|nr:GIY-YIG nuclease family protein [Streptomyces aculeolatus]
MTGPERTALYRLYDAKNRLLYVGITTDPKQRWKQHAYFNGDTWWPSVASQTVEWFSDRNAAERAETRAIEGERPLNNRSKVPAGRPVAKWVKPDVEVEDDRGTPLYLRVAKAIKVDIQTGLYPAGSRFLSGRAVARRYGLSMPTVYKVLRSLADDGLLEKLAGCSGYRVRDLTEDR